MSPTIPKLALLLSLLVLAGCQSPRPLGEQCSRNTECADRLVCRWARCRIECSGDRDCPPGLYCAVDNEGIGSCLFPEDTTCVPGVPGGCLEDLECTPTGECGSPCETSDSCLWSGECIDGFCVDVTVPGDGGMSDAGVPMLRDGEVCEASERCNGMDDDCDGSIDERADEFCDALPNASGECREGACRFACDPGFEDCNGVQMDGCEVELATDVAHCGMCDRACPTADGASAVCTGGMCGAPVCATGRGDCDGDSGNGCEAMLEVDDNNCGSCGRSCGAIVGGREQCVASDCVADCDVGFGDCNMDTADGCETDHVRDEMHCGSCGNACPMGLVCVPGPVGTGVCERAAFESTGADGGLTVMTGTTVLAAGTHHYTSITIAAGATVTSDGNGTLDLRAQGEVRIDGIIDVSGSVGGPSGTDNRSPGGGRTGNPTFPGQSMAMMCFPGGTGGTGAMGGNAPTAPMGCAEGGNRGGGAGGHGGDADTGGGGGGGYAGGGGGGGPRESGAAGASVGVDVGGAGGAPCAAGGGGRGLTTDVHFDGEDGDAPMCGFHGNGGGGGSIGERAALDPGVLSGTFYAGSGGGGGGSMGGLFGSGSSGAGGGGAGGALRISSATRITINGELRAAGGAGGPSSTVGGGGGGGSGGLVYLAAPDLAANGSMITVEGGLGGEAGDRDGGDGGPGRVRLSVDPMTCQIGTVLGATLTTCATNTSPMPGEAYVDAYPN